MNINAFEIVVALDGKSAIGMDLNNLEGSHSARSYGLAGLGTVHCSFCRTWYICSIQWEPWTFVFSLALSFQCMIIVSHHCIFFIITWTTTFLSLFQGIKTTFCLMARSFETLWPFQIGFVTSPCRQMSMKVKVISADLGFLHEAFKRVALMEKYHGQYHDVNHWVLIMLEHEGKTLKSQLQFDISNIDGSMLMRALRTHQVINLQLYSYLVDSNTFGIMFCEYRPNKEGGNDKLAGLWWQYQYFLRA